MTGYYAAMAILLDNDGKEMHRARIENIEIDREFTMGGTPVKTNIVLRGWVSEKDIVAKPADPLQAVSRGSVIGLLRAVGGEATFELADMDVTEDEQFTFMIKGNQVTLKLVKK
jgi:hypothetical protein